jgi:hypothetical protein
MSPRDLFERTRLFALAVVRFCRTLPPTDEAQETAKHLRRAGNATRSNYRASRKGRSREDCLEFLRDARIKSDPELLKEAGEIAKILGASVKTARTNTARLRNMPKS